MKTNRQAESNTKEAVIIYIIHSPDAIVKCCAWAYFFGATFAKDVPRDLIYETQIDILQIYWKQFSETLYQ